MKRAAITGILGQDGTYLARFLRQKGYEVHGLIRLPFDREEARIRRRFTEAEREQIFFHTGLVEDSFSMVRFLKKAAFDEVYHLAGVSDSRLSFAIPAETLHSITGGTLNLLEACRELSLETRIFLASSCEIFGTPTQTPQEETTAPQPVTPYGIAKLAADQFGRLHRDRSGQYVSIGILYNHESPLRPANYLSRRVAQAVAAIAQGRAAELELADLSPQRDWSDARDVIEGFWLSLQAPAPGDYLFCSGESRKVGDLVETAFHAAGLDYRKFVRVTERTQAAQQVTTGLCGNPARAASTLGWTRRWTFTQTITDMVQAELDQRAEIDRAHPQPERREHA
jgi:GDPmannose 4,6-dehydratase